MRKNNMISLTALMISTEMIYSRLFESIMLGNDFFVVNITIIQVFAHSIRKSISSIFHVFDIQILY